MLRVFVQMLCVIVCYQCGHVCRCVCGVCMGSVCTGLLEIYLQPQHLLNHEWWRWGSQYLSWAVVFKGYCFS